MSANAQLASEIVISPEQKMILNLQTMTKRNVPRKHLFFVYINLNLVFFFIFQVA